MDKEEILEKSRKENTFFDEREKQISTNGFKFGYIGMTISFIFLILLRYILKKEHKFYDLMTLYSSFFVIFQIYKYKMLKDRELLIPLFYWSLTMIVSLFLYIKLG